jgi:hypothetical protein
VGRVDWIMAVDWARVYDETFPDLVRYLYRKVWDAERARDLAQDAFARSIGREPDDPRSWVFTVAANLARDEARTDIRRRSGTWTLVRVERDAEARPADPLEQARAAAGRRPGPRRPGSPDRAGPGGAAAAGVGSQLPGAGRTARAHRGRRGHHAGPGKETTGGSIRGRGESCRTWMTAPCTPCSTGP